MARDKTEAVDSKISSHFFASITASRIGLFFPRFILNAFFSVSLIYGGFGVGGLGLGLGFLGCAFNVLGFGDCGVGPLNIEE